MHLALKKFIVPIVHVATALVYAGRANRVRRVFSGKVELSGEETKRWGDQAARALRCGVKNEFLALGGMRKAVELSEGGDGTQIRGNTRPKIRSTT